MRTDPLLTLVVAMTFLSSSLFAQKVKEPVVTDSEWTKPYPPFQIVGSLYYVGTYELASYLIVTDSGCILINTGVASSAAQIKKNIQTLGFQFSKIKILLTTQVHFDHVGAMAAIQKQTGALMMADAADTGVLADGGKSDYEFGRKGASFEPVAVRQKLYDKDTIRLGTIKLVLLHHPGHTKGSCSFLFDVKDQQKTYRVLIANLPSMVIKKPFSQIKKYPAIESDYAYTFSSMKHLSFDLWLSSHASQFGLQQKHKPGDAYNPEAFRDQAGYDAAIGELEVKYKQKQKEI